jgi:hypothetical protein
MPDFFFIGKNWNNLEDNIQYKEINGWAVTTFVLLAFASLLLSIALARSHSTLIFLLFPRYHPPLRTVDLLSRS